MPNFNVYRQFSGVYANHVVRNDSELIFELETKSCTHTHHKKDQRTQKHTRPLETNNITEHRVNLARSVGF